MTEDTDNPYTVTVDRLSLATALDLLREYETELEDSGADEGPYTNEISETIDNWTTLSSTAVKRSLPTVKSES